MGVLPPGTYGLWGDNAALFLRGYTIPIEYGRCTDETILDFTYKDHLFGWPLLFIIPTHMPNPAYKHKDCVIRYKWDTLKDPEQPIWRVKAKLIATFDTSKGDPPADVPPEYLIPEGDGQRVSFYLDVAGNPIRPDDPSGLPVFYTLYDRG